MKIQAYLVILFVFLGFLFGVMSSLAFVKGKRGEGKRMELSNLYFATFLLAGPGCLLVYLLSKEIREEDRMEKRKYLLLILTAFVLEILVLFLLSYFGIIDWNSNNAGETASALLLR